MDGHGDLLAEDIFCLDDGPRILDCLDFDDQLRWLDGLDDAAFLAMDLERLGRPRRWRSSSSAAYAEYSGDPAPASLRHHYVAYRAFVRAKVACLRVAQGDPQRRLEARRLADIALRHLRAGAVTLVLIGGLPGQASQRWLTPWPTVSGSRAEQRPHPQGTGRAARRDSGRARYSTGIYTAGCTDAPTASCCAAPAILLAHGESVIADASLSPHRQRAAAAAAAGESAPT